MPPATPTCEFKCSGRECFLKGPSDINTGKRLLVGADGRPDTQAPTPGQFEKRFLNKVSGRDNIAAVYHTLTEEQINGTQVITPLDIPTRIINTSQYYLPGIKLEKVLNNFSASLVPGSRGQRRLEANVIEGEISNGPVTLSTGLEHNVGTHF